MTTFEVGKTYKCSIQTHNNPYNDLPYEPVTLLKRTARYGTFRLKRTGEIRRCLIRNAVFLSEDTMIYGGLYYADHLTD